MSAMSALPLFILFMALGKKSWKAHFRDEETEVQRGKSHVQGQACIEPEFQRSYQHSLVGKWKNICWG
jgi:hypothetical protein